MEKKQSWEKSSPAGERRQHDEDVEQHAEEHEDCVDAEQHVHRRQDLHVARYLHANLLGMSRQSAR